MDQRASQWPRDLPGEDASLVREERSHLLPQSRSGSNETGRFPSRHRSQHAAAALPTGIVRKYPRWANTSTECHVM